MNVKTLDCKGMTCPQPLMECRKCLEAEAPEALDVLVDDEAALENVSRYLKSSGFGVTSSKEGARWAIRARREGGQAAPADPADFPCPVPGSGQGQRIVVFLTSDVVGRGDDGLGAKLMLNFIKTLPELGSELWRIVMVNAAVKLAAEGSPHIETLRALEAAGVSILVCGTCLEFYGLMQQRAVGQTTNMLDVVTSLQLASKVIDI
ncbi:sulfurtransferase-like selenium metabolism protein YedF [Fundidesulfovibrio agrisoli]|uniref:sulfurtransferase-like selenium metabolism protein YedF n=1 Tax=Fundidesulfovibrio agrisoli TaxID=2922717 RepID=UPI001FAD4534|nr:sulfurtransferase-like selenium metabolism protein YedF [Fundidesulfovibrio agrisoli]